MNTLRWEDDGFGISPDKTIRAYKQGIIDGRAQVVEEVIKGIHDWADNNFEKGCNKDEWFDQSEIEASIRGYIFNKLKK